MKIVISNIVMFIAMSLLQACATTGSTVQTDTTRTYSPAVTQESYMFRSPSYR